VISIQGFLFFGAASHVEDVLLRNYADNKGQNFLLLNLHGVNRIDLAGIEMIEVVLKLYRDVGGDLYLGQVRTPVRELMQHSEFEDVIGKDHFLEQEEAIEFLFDKVLDPAVCCYECEHRIFAECQAIEKHPYDSRLPSFSARQVKTGKHLNVHELEKLLKPSEKSIVIVDVREPGEYNAGHLTGARLIPLRLVIEQAESLPRDCPIVLISRSGRRCHRAMSWLLEMGFDRVYRLKGGILSWKAHGKPIEVD
jgi:SulP family sulfate permease